MFAIYGAEKPVKPTRFRPEVKNLHAYIQTFLKTNVTFLGDFMSCRTLSTDGASNNSNSNPYMYPVKQSSKERKLRTTDLIDCLISTKKWIEEVYELTRTVASEILVYMVNDFDRMYNPEVSLAHPIAYAMKGSSMNNIIFRKMTDEVISQCEHLELPILATSSDGQWHKYSVRNEKDKPLTILQLQKDHWKRVYSIDKKSIVSMIKKACVVRNIEDVDYKKLHLGPLVVFKHARDKNIVGLLRGNRRIVVNPTGDSGFDSTEDERSEGNDRFELSPTYVEP